MHPRGAALRQLPTGDLTPSDLSALRALFEAAWPDGAFTDDDFVHAMGGMHWLAEVDGAIVAHVFGGQAAARGGRPRAANRVPRGGGHDAGVRTARLRLDGGPRGRPVPAAAVRARRALDAGARVLPSPWLGAVARTDVRCGRPAGRERTEDDDGSIFILRTPSTPSLVARPSRSSATGARATSGRRSTIAHPKSRTRVAPFLARAHHRRQGRQASAGSPALHPLSRA